VSSLFETLAAGLGRVLSFRALKLGGIVVVILVLYGRIPGAQLWLLLAVVVAGRSAYLTAEAIRKRWAPADWDELYRKQLADFHDLAQEDFESEAEKLGLPSDSTAEQLARVLVEGRQQQYVDSRPWQEIATEWVGLVAFGLLLPLDFALYTRDIVSARSGYSYLGAGVAALSFALYAWPHRWAPTEGLSDRRKLWWGLPIIPLVILVYTGVTTHHPYLDLRRPDRVQLRAERVVSLGSTVQAASHTDWVVEYAAELEAQGELERAADLYRKAARLAPQVKFINERLAAHEHKLNPGLGEADVQPRDPRNRARGIPPDEFARLPFWIPDGPTVEVPSCSVDGSLEEVSGTTVVLVTVGDVPFQVTNAIGDVLHLELGLSSCRAQESPVLPDATRFRGVVFGRQWSIESLVKNFHQWVQPVPNAPLRFLLVTGVDIYSQDSSFVFSGTYSWGAVLSYARLGDVDGEWETVRHRTAKQAIGSLLKSFDLPPSSDPNCVTSYSNGVPQFDAKGNRPNTETFLRFREKVDAEDRRWRAYRARKSLKG
jgi:predicted Zn-dependent protease